MPSKSSHPHRVHAPSISAGLSKSILKILPVDSANTSTLFATAAATKSELMLNCSDTRSMLNMGSAASSCAWGAYPLVMSYAIVGVCARRVTEKL
jgi:hypothetical protein